MKRKTIISTSLAAVLVLGAAGTAAFGFSGEDIEGENNHDDVISNDESQNDIPEDEMDESSSTEDADHLFGDEGGYIEGDFTHED